jgi:hypothetical protein
MRAALRGDGIATLFRFALEGLPEAVEHALGL